jgi:hypothetical protein
MPVLVAIILIILLALHSGLLKSAFCFTPVGHPRFLTIFFPNKELFLCHLFVSYFNIIINKLEDCLLPAQGP